ncbi:Tol-Pal system protein TolB [Sulfurimonas sp. MAG313]|nr:Tol-Pal system protein TolB [Sulfurimonas sp. MAG313]MDF1881936.1 Tol-Pal system protein TolB [Sulfurimonas sp. MAG313]
MKKLFLFALLVSQLFAADATIEVIKKVDKLPSISVEDASINYQNTLSKKFFKVLVSDLDVLSVFNVYDNYEMNDYDADDVKANNIKRDYVLRYRLRQDDDGHLNCDYKLISAADSQVVRAKNFRIKKENLYVFLIHNLAIDINDFIGSEPVDWMKSYVLISRLTGANESEIVISDYTLTYQHVMVKGGLNVFPHWADKEQSALYYTSLNELKPTLYKLDRRTGKSEKILSSDGMMICSDVSLDGERILVTMAPEGQPDIFLYELRTKKLTRLTTFSGIDVGAQFLENDTEIAFVSNRGGYPNIFSKRIGSKGVQQMVYYGKSNVALAAYKNYIVYKSRETSNEFSHNTFNLHLISTRSDFIRRLTATGINEFPRFSQNGDSIIFIKNYKSESSLGIIRIKQNKSFLFPLKIGKIQSIDW